MSEAPAHYCVLEEKSTHQQLLDRVRSLARELAEARAALHACEARENDLIDRMRVEGGL